MTKPLPMLALAVAALAPAASRGQGAPPDPRFGVMTHFAQGWDPTWIPQIAQAGITQVRDELYWQSVEPQRGNYTFPAAFDIYMSALQQSRISPLIILDFANSGYDGGNTPYTADGFSGYSNYTAQLLARYGPQITAVEVWNEYNGSFCTGPAAQNRAATYLPMLQAAYQKIKAARPDVTVVGGATSGIPVPYWTELLEGGALNSMDALSVHPYQYNSPPEGLELEIASLQNLVRQYNGGKPKPIWVTEIGWMTQASTAPGVLAIDDTTLAKYLVRAYALLLSAQVERIYWYEFRDDQGLTMGLVNGDAQNTPKPAYFAMGTLIAQLSQANFLQREATPPGLYSLEFQRPSGEQVRVLWSLQPTTLTVQGATKAVDMLGNAVSAAGPLNLTDAPIFVTGPLTGLPPPPPATETLVTNSVTDFSATQGTNGWSYGTFTNASADFTPLPTFSITDWTEAWTGVYPFISVTAGDQHPSVAGDDVLLAVRRWVSNQTGPVHVVGSFQCSTQGDGVGVSILVNGDCRFRVLLGGGNGNTIVQNFDFTQLVQPGTTIDFAVDPGPDEDINFDATTLTVTISAPLSPQASAKKGPSRQDQVLAVSRAKS